MVRYCAEDRLPHFCTITVHDWIPVFIEARYIHPVIDSLSFCRTNKGLQLFAIVVMPNHVHFIAAAEDLQAVMRDYKRFTSRTIHDRLKSDGRGTILSWLETAGQRARVARGEFSFWQDGYHPQVIFTRQVFDQKLRYLHENPVRKGLVAVPEDWQFSSARWYSGCGSACMSMDPPEF